LSTYNGCYAYAGYQHNGKPVYVHTSRSNVLISWNTDSASWYTNKDGTVGSFGDYSSVNAASPADGVLDWITPAELIAPAPTQTMGCSVPAYFVQSSAAWGGKYCEDGTFNGKPKYSKTGTSLYMYYVETNWRINDVGNLGNLGSNVYGLAMEANTPPTGLNWLDNNTSNLFSVLMDSC
jgi:hypothetical protein